MTWRNAWEFVLESVWVQRALFLLAGFVVGALVF